jgi:hypothetical protein
MQLKYNMKTSTTTSNGEVLQQAIADRQPTRSLALINASPWHRPLKDQTSRVCEHVEMFEPERYRRQSKWTSKPTRESSANNAIINRYNRKLQRLMDAGKVEAAYKLMSANRHMIAK